MAFIQMEFFSSALMRTVPVNVILPVDKMAVSEMEQEEDKPLRTLYLLHGVYGGYGDWILNSNIQRYADKYDLTVVMPGGENAFYIDQPKAHNLFGEFIGKELVEITRKTFPLSHKREDTFIGGLSMGGYGALRNGLKYADTFSKIIALSPALIFYDVEKRTNDVSMFILGRDYAEHVFGDLDRMAESDKNLETLISALIENQEKIPALFIASGEDDEVVGADVSRFVNFLKEKEVDFTFMTAPGGHEWPFWDTFIEKGIDWLDIAMSDAGLGSGNIGI